MGVAAPVSDRTLRRTMAFPGHHAIAPAPHHNLTVRRRSCYDCEELIRCDRISSRSKPTGRLCMARIISSREDERPEPTVVHPVSYILFAACIALLVLYIAM